LFNEIFLKYDEPLILPILQGFGRRQLFSMPG